MKTSRMEMVALPGMPMVKPADALALLIADGITRAGEILRDGDVLVLAQKIVSKAKLRGGPITSNFTFCPNFNVIVTIMNAGHRHTEGCKTETETDKHL